MTRVLSLAEWRSANYREAMLASLVDAATAAERAECARLRLPLPVRGGTTFTGAETLASMPVGAAAVGPTAALLSVLSRDCLEAVAPSYFRQAGNRFWIRAFGNIAAVSVVPTLNMQLVVGPTYANPLTAGQMIAQTGAITAAVQANGDWYLDCIVTVRAVGSSGSLIVNGQVENNWASAAAYVGTPFRNASPPTAVVLTGAGGMLVPLYFDLEIIHGAATAGNTVTCLDYQLVSVQ